MQPQEFAPESRTERPLPLRARYPWHVWTRDNLPRVYVRGKHFFTTAANFRRAALNYAKLNGLLLRTSIRDSESVILQWHTPSGVHVEQQAEESDRELPPLEHPIGPRPGVTYMAATEYRRKRKQLKSHRLTQKKRKQ